MLANPLHDYVKVRCRKMQQLLGISCGLDVHKDVIEACILISNGTGEPERVAETFTAMRGDLYRLKDWLAVNGCANVAMESTGVYWKPVYEILEEADEINLCLVNAHHMRNVPGRKNDKADAEWIASLFMCGLLDSSFVPEKGVRDLKEYTRYCVKLTQEKVRLVNRIEKLLQAHGFKLSSVLSSVVGVSGLRILEVLSECGSVSTADVRNSLARGVKKSADEIAYAINGELSQSSRALLRLMLDALHSYEVRLEVVRSGMQSVGEPYSSQIHLLSTIPGIDVLSASYIIGEIGVDMSRFRKGAASLANWAGLAPRDDESAGKIKSNKILKGNPYVKSILCQCAWAATRTRDTRPSNWYWRNVKRLGQKKAIIAVARKLLVYAFHMLSTGELYDTRLDAADTENLKAIKLASAKQQVSMLEPRQAGMGEAAVAAN
jgi:transposase